MKKSSKLLLILMVLPFVFMSCGNSIANQIKNEMQAIKDECPQEQGNGVVMTDANFYEDEKILEYVCSLEGVEHLDSEEIDDIKNNLIEALSQDITGVEKFSVKLMLKQGYTYRYIYTDTENNKLCEIDITKDDLL